MKKNYFFILPFVMLFSQMTTAQTTVSGWNFNSSTTTASLGSGTLSFVGGTGSPTYVNNSGSQALAFANFPNATVGSGTAGIKFALSTVGYAGISISFDTSGHNQSSKWQQYEYTTDGSTWTVLSNNSGGLTASFCNKVLNFPSSCDNNPNFAFRVVSIFNPSGGTQYEQVQGGGYNGSNGKWYFDNVDISYGILGVKENTLSTFKMYPNPAKNVLNISTNSAEAKQVDIYNVLGKIVLSEKTSNNTLNIASLNSGIYMVKVTQHESSITKKLVIK